MTLTVGGLFSGIGGFEYGLRKSGMTVTSLCEIEPACHPVLNKHFPNVPIHNDITTMPTLNADVLCGGFPCQDISISGRGVGIEGERSGLWKEYKHVIKTSLPKYAIIENVSALRSRGLEIVLQDLAEIGYDATWTMLDSKFFGTPNRRRRFYIVAARDGIPEGSDLFQFKGRNTDRLRYEVDNFDEGFEWNFTPLGSKSDTVAYLTRQRSDQFAEIGVSSTLCKRDWKDFMDVVVYPDKIRRVMPVERLRLQGLPSDYYEGCGLSNRQEFEFCGMSVNTVEWIGNQLVEFDNAYG